MGRDAPPASPPEGRRDPPAAVSHWGFALGIVLGILLGLGCTWLLGPLQEFNTEPHQLRPDERHHYLAAIALEYMHRGDLARAVGKLTELRLPLDPIQAMADAACELGSSDYIESSSRITAVRAMITFYQMQGRRGCAERLLPGLALSSALIPEDARPASQFALPPPSKTPPPNALSGIPAVGLVPVVPAPRQFEGRLADSFCDAALPGLIEVSVVDFLGAGIPGERIRVRWGGGESVFVSGLKVERGDAYADFQMERGIRYTIDMPGAAESLEVSLSAEPCSAGDGGESLQSYRAVFRQVG